MSDVQNTNQQRTQQPTELSSEPQPTAVEATSSPQPTREPMAVESSTKPAADARADASGGDLHAAADAD